MSVRALLDTGSAANIISNRVFKEIASISLKKCKITLCSINSSPINVHGAADLVINVGEKECSISVIVADVSSDMVLGNPFIKEHGALLDLEGRQLIFPEKPEISVKINKVLLEPNPAAVQMESVLDHDIQGQTTEWVICKISDKGRSIDENTGVIVPRPQLGESTPLQSLRRYDSHANDKFMLLVVNQNENVLEIRCGKVIADIHPELPSSIPLEFQESDCTSVYGMDLNLSEQECQERWDELLKVLKLEEWCLNDTEKKIAADALKPYEFVFALKDEPLGLIPDYEHRIELNENVKPISQKPRPLNDKKLSEVEKIVEDLLERGLVRHSRSAWSSPICMVQKPDKSYRLAIDYRKLNDVTVKDSHPLPNITYLLSTMKHSSLFSTMDMASGYHQLQLAEESIPLTAFCTPTGLFEYLVLLFGLANAPSSFVRAMTSILKIDRSKALLYLDDVLILGIGFEEHLRNMTEVLSILQGANIKLKARKTTLFSRKVKFLGHIVTEAGITSTDSKIKAIKELPYPTTPKETRSYLGVFGYYRRFVESYSTIARPPHKLAVADRKDFVWTTEAEEAFDLLRSKLTSPPILAIAQPDDFYTLTTDASQYGIGSVLSVSRPEGKRVVCYASHLLEKSRVAYPITKKELWAVVFYVRYHTFFLQGKKFRIETDHRCLTYLTTFKEPSALLTRWLETLAEYDYEIVYKPGTCGDMKTADLLSRIDPNIRRAVATVEFDPAGKTEEPPIGAVAETDFFNEPHVIVINL